MRIIHNPKQRRKIKVRKTIRGSQERPRISVFRSNVHLYAQAIADDVQKTLASISTLAQSKETKKVQKLSVDASKELGKQFADKLKEIKINEVVFDRGPYAYKGNVKAFTEGLRENGIKI